MCVKELGKVPNAHSCSDELPKVKWRDRKKEQGRLVKCSCGKRYLYGYHYGYMSNSWFWKKYDDKMEYRYV